MMADPKIERLRELKAQASFGGGKERIAAHKAKGKLTACERIDLLLDEGSFREIDLYVSHAAAEEGCNPCSIRRCTP